MPLDNKVTDCPYSPVTRLSHSLSTANGFCFWQFSEFGLLDESWSEQPA